MPRTSNRDYVKQYGEVLPVLPLKNAVLFPEVMLPVTTSRPYSKLVLDEASRNNSIFVVLTQKDPNTPDPTIDDLYSIGTIARVHKIVTMPDNDNLVIVEGLDRVQVGEVVCNDPNNLQVHITPIPEITIAKNDLTFITLCKTLKELALDVLNISHAPNEVNMGLRSIDKPVLLVNYICTNFNTTAQERQPLLEMDDLNDRVQEMLVRIKKKVQELRMNGMIEDETKKVIDKEQREYYLHRQIETIQKELGDTGAKVVEEMKRRAEGKKWSEEIAKVFQDELRKLQRMSNNAPDYSTQQNYLETLLALPWNEYTEDNYDIKHAREQLNQDHYGLEKVKERILEYLAVQKQLHDTQAQHSKTPILCLYGPPGVGKTSLGRSIAQALGRKYARISLGGLHDEAEIRGHRRTYIGAMPGRIIENIQKVQSSNPVFVLDEIDKIGADYKGDPTSALLEVLDPEQNTSFHDNFLNVNYDLSKVLFIATANTLDTIPRPLLDRMELIEMTGYLMEEKEEIAIRHLIPKELEDHGLKAEQLQFTRPVIEQIIDDYTRESGVRSLERQIATICRKVVTRMAMEEAYNTTLSKDDIITYLGQKRFSRDQYETNYVGVVTGLAWTQVGGEILFIETSLSPAKQPTLTITGNLGDVMKESATLALGYIKAHAEELGISRKDIDTHSVHIHVPEGATPKDGPSAGITITTALVSAFTRTKVRPRIAMTGEMTLRGKVLAIGGVKEKILAAKRAGITELILCKDNRKDVEQIDQQYLAGLRFHYVTDIQEVIDLALSKK